MTHIWSHSTFMTNFSFLEKHVNIMKTYHSYIWIVTQTCLAKYREFLKMKENSKGKYCEYGVIIQCDFLTISHNHKHQGCGGSTIQWVHVYLSLHIQHSTESDAYLAETMLLLTQGKSIIVTLKINELQWTNYNTFVCTRKTLAECTPMYVSMLDLYSGLH